MTTTTTATANWLESLEISETATPADAKAFFGIPPDPDSKLDANINKKRRTWSTKVRRRDPGPEAKRKVEEALKVIDFLGEYLKRGTDDPLDLADLREAFKQAPTSTVGDIDELWRVVEELLASGQLDEALRVANEAKDRYTGHPTADLVFGWVSAQASRTLADATPRMRRDGLEAIERAIAAGETNIDAITARVVLQLDLERPQDALDGLENSRAALDGGKLSPWLLSHEAEAHAQLGSATAAIRSAVAAVNGDPTDLALRGNTANALVQLMRGSLLPIADKAGLAAYRLAAETAAWCALGAPEAEDFVRPYRMWATQAGTRVYTGEIGFRAFAAVVSGFLLLPVMNRVRSKPQWKVLHKGPTAANPDVFDAVVFGAAAELVHEGLYPRLPWWADFERAARDAG